MLFFLLITTIVHANTISIPSSGMETVLLTPKSTVLSSLCDEGKHKGSSYILYNTSPFKMKLQLDFYNNPPHELHARLGSSNKCLMKSDSKVHLSELSHVLLPHQKVELHVYSTENGQDVDSRVVVRLRCRQPNKSTSVNKGLTCPEATPLRRPLFYRGTGMKWYKINVKKGERRIISTCSPMTHLPVSYDVYDTCSGNRIQTETVKCSNPNSRAIAFKPKTTSTYYVKVTSLPGQRKENKRLLQMKRSKQNKNSKRQKFTRRFNFNDRYLITTFSNTTINSHTNCNKAKMVKNPFFRDTFVFEHAKSSSGCSKHSRAFYYKVLIPRRQKVVVTTATWKTTGAAHIEVLNKCNGNCIKYPLTKSKYKKNNEQVTIPGASRTRWVIVRISEVDTKNVGEVTVQFSRPRGRNVWRFRRFRRGLPWWVHLIQSRRLAALKKKRLHMKQSKPIHHKQSHSNVIHYHDTIHSNQQTNHLDPIHNQNNIHSNINHQVYEKPGVHQSIEYHQPVEHHQPIEQPHTIISNQQQQTTSIPEKTQSINHPQINTEYSMPTEQYSLSTWILGIVFIGLVGIIGGVSYYLYSNNNYNQYEPLKLN
ncbi:Uncharacterized protein QTN25_004943 [Entamoeba marina]